MAETWLYVVGAVFLLAAVVAAVAVLIWWFVNKNDNAAESNVTPAPVDESQFLPLPAPLGVATIYTALGGHYKDAINSTCLSANNEASVGFVINNNSGTTLTFSLKNAGDSCNDTVNLFNLSNTQKVVKWWEIDLPTSPLIVSTVFFSLYTGAEVTLGENFSPSSFVVPHLDVNSQWLNIVINQDKSYTVTEILNPDIDTDNLTPPV